MAKLKRKTLRERESKRNRQNLVKTQTQKFYLTLFDSKNLKSLR